MVPPWYSLTNGIVRTIVGSISPLRRHRCRKLLRLLDQSSPWVGRDLLLQSPTQPRAKSMMLVRAIKLLSITNLHFYNHDSALISNRSLDGLDSRFQLLDGGIIKEYCQWTLSIALVLTTLSIYNRGAISTAFESKTLNLVTQSDICTTRNQIKTVKTASCAPNKMSVEGRT